ncbi:MAG: copper chaperone [Bacteroidia bacterium]|jgi:copper chaperone
MNIIKYKTNINCENCIKSVTPFLNEIDNIDTWKVDINHPDKILEVLLDDKKSEAVINAVVEAGFNIEPTSA